MNRALSTLITVLPLAACSSVSYEDPGRVEALDPSYSQTDLQTLAAGMVESLITAPQLNYLDASGKADDKRVIVYVGDIENRTSEHIETAGIADKIEVSLLKSGKFRFVAADAGQEEIGEQVRFQQGSGRVREDMQRAFGKQLGADVVLYGVLRSIDKRKGGSIESAGTRKETKYYQFVLRAVNIDTGETIWLEEEEIFKTARTGIFGRT